MVTEGGMKVGCSLELVRVGLLWIVSIESNAWLDVDAYYNAIEMSNYTVECVM